VFVRLAAVSILCPIWTISALTQAELESAPGESPVASEVLKPGIVIEKFEDQFSAAKKAGMQEGDVLLRWSRDEAKGELESPFDLSLVVTEQLARGPVRFEGFRGTEERSWTVDNEWWGAIMRPNFSDAALSIYHETMKMAERGEPEAIQHWRAAAGDSQWPHYPWLGPWFLEETAEALEKSQHWKEADDAYQQAILLSGPTGASVRSQLFAARGGDLEQRGDLDQADKYYEQAITESGPIHAENLIAEVLVRRGDVARFLGNISQSLEFLSRSLEIRQRLEPGRSILANSLVNYGNAVFDRGDLAEAEKYFLQAKAIFPPVSVGAAVVLNNLGEAAELRGDLTQAERYFRKSLAIIEKLSPGTQTQASILRSYAATLEEEGRNPEAESSLRQSLAIQEKLAPDSLDSAEIRQSLGNLALHRAEWNVAEQAYLQALAIREKLAPKGLAVAETLHDLGYIALTRGELVKSEAYYQRALAIREKLAPKGENHANTLAALAEIAEREGLIEKAESYYEQALDALEAQSARFGGSADDQAYFRAKHENYYREYINLLVSQKQPALAFYVLERARARGFLEILATAHIDIRKGADAALLERERSLRADIHAKSERHIRLMGEQGSEQTLKAVEKEISDLLLQHQDVEAQLRLISPVYAALTQPHPLTAQQVQTDLLDPDTLLLEYSLGKDRSYVFALTPDSLTVHELPKQAEIEAAARRLHRILAAGEVHHSSLTTAEGMNQQRADFQKTASLLSRMVLAPVARELKHKRLLIVSDGSLLYVPFAALPIMEGEAAQKPAGVRGPVPLMANHEIVNLPSASVLAELRAASVGRSKGSRAVAVIADPVFDVNDVRVQGSARGGSGLRAGTSRPTRTATTEAIHAEDADDPISEGALARSVADVSAGSKGVVYLPRLYFSRREAESIMQVTPPGQRMAALDFEASRTTALSPELAQYRIVHFSTHGLMDSKHPELSGLVLSLVDHNGRLQHGFLNLQDIYNLNLNAELVVLSACQTGLGKEVRGEGLVGLTRGFMYAGAKRVVASLWNVEDRATAEFMGEFYKAMEQHGRRPAAALRDAQIAIWKQKRWSSPYYWAAFQIHGEWE
jgi:CHAT domain-containing protein/Tfp pilus assembly protein PilF